MMLARPDQRTARLIVDTPTNDPAAHTPKNTTAHPYARLPAKANSSSAVELLRPT